MRAPCAPPWRAKSRREPFPGPWRQDCSCARLRPVPSSAMSAVDAAAARYSRVEPARQLAGPPRTLQPSPRGGSLREVPVAAVTPAGVRDGHPDALAGLCARRGPAVLAYCEHIVGDGHAVIAAAEAFRRFRAAVVQAPDLAGLNPEALLISATRTAAAAHVPQPPQPPEVLRHVAHRPATGWCGDVPTLLAARANRRISRIDLARLEQHLSGCPACRAPEARFNAAERAYRDPPATQMPLPTTAAIIAALATAAPIRAVAAEASSMNGPLAPLEPLAATAPPEPPASPAPPSPPAAPVVESLPPPAPPAAAPPPPPPEPPIAVEVPEPAPAELYAQRTGETEAPQAVAAGLTAPSGSIDAHDSGQTMEYRSSDFVDAVDEPVEPARSPGRRRRKALPSLPSVSLPSLSLPSVSLPSVSLPSVSLPKLPKLPTRTARPARPARERERVSPMPRPQRAVGATARASSSPRPSERVRPAALLPIALIALAIVIAMAVAGVFGGGGDAASPKSVSPVPTTSSGAGRAPDVVVVPGGGASAAAVEAAKARARARAKRDAQRQSGSAAPATPRSSPPAGTGSGSTTQQRDTAAVPRLAAAP